MLYIYNVIYTCLYCSIELIRTWTLYMHTCIYNVVCLIVMSILKYM